MGERVRAGMVRSSSVVMWKAVAANDRALKLLHRISLLVLHLVALPPP
jgi:hypothetical protein